MFGHDRRSLGQLLGTPVEGKGTSWFIVPKYQRKYTWEKEDQVAKLIDDVFGNLGKTYFMGPLIICSDKLAQASIKEDCVELTDGQQRLATFSIFIRALMDYIQQRQADIAFPENLRERMNHIQFELRSKIIKGGLVQNIPVIHLSPKINPFFKDEIIMTSHDDKVTRLQKLRKGQHPSIIKLIDAYMKIWDSIRDRYDAKMGEGLVLELHKLASSILDEKIFLVIAVHDYSDAYTIFETINWRGKPLTLSDLVKNLCFRKFEGSLSEDDLDYFENEWDEAELLVSDFALFMWHAWVSRYDTCPRSGVFGELQKFTKEMDAGKVFDFAADLILGEVKYYNIYENSDKEQDEDKKRYLEMLRTMDATRCYPLLLAIDHAQRGKGTITIKDATELLKIITRLTFWYSGICSRDAKSLETTYHKLAKKIRGATKQTSESIIEEIIQELCNKSPTEEECKASFTTRGFTDKGFIKMVLQEIEKRQYHKGELTLKGSKDVQLEHILPRNPDETWKEIYKNKNEMMEHVYKFGNYTLLLGALNKSARNGPFSEKKTFYEKSQVGLTRELIKVEEWNAEIIEKRTIELYTLTKDVWPLL